jgi:hypothetical protein
MFFCKNIIKYKSPLLLLAFFTSCSSPPLHLHTAFISKDQLASYHVGTPDPRLMHPDIGQRLVIQWSLPTNLYNYPDLQLVVVLRLANGTEQQLNYPITQTWHSVFHPTQHYGTEVFTLLDEEFLTTGGIITYKAKIHSGSVVLAEWYHCLWNETITVDAE